MEDTTPMLRQYLEIKKQYPGTLLMFRLGDFYELFNEDAILGARELQITLTARQKDSKNPIPMCGVPHHAAPSYIAKLVRKGYRVAICEQAEPAAKGTKLVRREVVRVVTPGTAIDPQILEAKDSVYLAAVCVSEGNLGAAFLELSTGELTATEIAGSDPWPRFRELIEGYSPRELIFPAELAAEIGKNFGSQHDNPEVFGMSDANPPESKNGSFSFSLCELENGDFDLATSEELLLNQFKVRELSGYGLTGRAAAVRAAGACLRYAHFTQKALAGHVTELNYLDASEYLVLDLLTLRNLEIVQSRGDSAKHTLCEVIDETVTGMGGRLLRSWLIRPSVKRSEIETRLAAVEELQDPILRDKIRFLMKQVSDLERLVGRVNLGNASPRDIFALGSTLGQAPRITESIADARSLLLQVLSENIFELPDVTSLISRAIVEMPPANLNEGNIIRVGFNVQLDELRSLSSDAKKLVAEYEESERARTGIASLKVRFNSVFGYYIEISKSNASRAPEDYHRRQTLANAERFTTPQLREWESKILGAEEKARDLENILFVQVVEAVKNETHRLQTTARAIATLDALASLAETAARRDYVRPLLHDGDEIEIKNGRHPVVEAYMKDSFVPNDIYLNNSTDRMLIVTGANMGGKSTVLRQTALIQVLGQMGSFVPASSARLPIVDRIWTRVGASDDLASGRSTFMVEMTETATILHNATPRSLILLDEIGRGTSTFDGLSIAWAVAEYLHNSPKHSAKTIFATHYHELTELAENLSGAKNYLLAATERDGEVVFLHKLQKGTATRSYGIAVARLAGLPASVVERATEVLAKLERYELAIFSDENGGQKGLRSAVAKASAAQVSLFALNNERAIDELRSIDLEAMTPEESKALLSSLQNQII